MFLFFTNRSRELLKCFFSPFCCFLRPLSNKVSFIEKIARNIFKSLYFSCLTSKTRYPDEEDLIHLVRQANESARAKILVEISRFRDLHERFEHQILNLLDPPGNVSLDHHRLVCAHLYWVYNVFLEKEDPALAIICQELRPFLQQEELKNLQTNMEAVKQAIEDFSSQLQKRYPNASSVLISAEGGQLEREACLVVVQRIREHEDFLASLLRRGLVFNQDRNSLLSTFTGERFQREAGQSGDLASLNAAIAQLEQGERSSSFSSLMVRLSNLKKVVTLFKRVSFSLMRDKKFSFSGESPIVDPNAFVNLYQVKIGKISSLIEKFEIQFKSYFTWTALFYFAGLSILLFFASPSLLVLFTLFVLGYAWKKISSLRKDCLQQIDKLIEDIKNALPESL
ncbi:hypothetical protein [Candidatus Similichlamydia laticola]|nr:hypothetical protein [Candidatus Similichlamydia laticola]